MKKTVAAAVLTAGLAFVAAPAMATTNTDGCTITQVHIPAVTKTVTVPAVYAVEYEFVFKKEGHPNSPRWENQGWNADSNPQSEGWRSTGVTREGELLTPARDEEVVVTEPWIKDVEGCLPPVVVPPVKGHDQDNGCPPVIPPHGEPGPVDVPPVDVPPVVVPPAVTPPVVEQPPVVPPVVVPPVVTVPEAVTPAAPAMVPAAVVAPVKAAVPAAAPEQQLAMTGAADWVLPAGLTLLAAGASLAGVARFTRRKA